MSTFHIESTQIWRIVCKQCVARARFDNVDDAHNWMREHECFVQAGRR